MNAGPSRTAFLNEKYLRNTYSIQVFFQIIWDSPQNTNYGRNVGRVHSQDTNPVLTFVLPHFQLKKEEYHPLSYKLCSIHRPSVPKLMDLAKNIDHPLCDSRAGKYGQWRLVGL